ncbi:MAG: hypothetical protein MHM6MM_002522 [Cercozoa sp. M6MM]
MWVSFSSTLTRRAWSARRTFASAQKGTRVLLSASNDAHFNLAVEDAIFRDMPVGAGDRVLFLWRNSPTVVIGRAQNPWVECNTRRMERDGITLARRQTGGGAVFHDFGNTCFTFMSSKEDYDRTKSTDVVIRALRRLGVQAQASGRNDLVVHESDSSAQEQTEGAPVSPNALPPRKISGSAYRETRDRCFHHGTVLIDADLTRLGNYLTPDEKKLVSKGVTSVRSRVGNLVDMVPDGVEVNHDVICDMISEEFQRWVGHAIEPEVIHPDQFDLGGLQERYDMQRSDEWNFGQAPRFEHHVETRFEWGGLALHIDVQRGATIKQAVVFTDALDPTPLENLAAALQGVIYRPDVVANVAAQCGLPDVAQWLRTALA